VIGGVTDAWSALAWGMSSLLWGFVSRVEVRQGLNGREAGDGRRETIKVGKPSGRSSHYEMPPEGSRFLHRFPSPGSRKAEDRQAQLGGLRLSSTL